LLSIDVVLFPLIAELNNQISIHDFKKLITLIKSIIDQNKSMKNILCKRPSH
jgi:hypothetical protein